MKMKTALVYDRINKWGGAERELLALHKIFPEAPLFTSVYHSGKAQWAKVFPKIYTSFLQNISFIRDKHELIPFLMPFAFESFDFSEFELVISLSSEAAKGIITKHPTKHLSICLSPTRYLWNSYETYFNTRLKKYLSKPIVSHLRKWDKIAAKRADMTVAISNEIKNRIKKYYDIESTVIYPPVEIEKFYSENNSKNNFYLIVSRLVPYKGVDYAIKAFNKLGKQLLIIGKGKEEEKLMSIAKGNVEFIKDLDESELINYYSKAKALVFPGIDDFGLTPLESQAAGTPVIAFRGGGSLETVVENKTGIFFDNQNPESLINAVEKFEKMKFNHNYFKENCERFSFENFKKQLLFLINSNF